jgi:hypothetical protein
MPEFSERYIQVLDKQRTLRRSRKRHFPQAHGSPANPKASIPSAVPYRRQRAEDFKSRLEGVLRAMPGSKWAVLIDADDLEPQGGSNQSWTSYKLLTQRSELEQECAGLRRENEDLTEQVLELRRLLSKVSARQPTGDSQEIAGGAFDNRAGAAEMLANVDLEEFELLWHILENGELDIKNLQNISDLSRVVRVISWLSSCHSIVLEGDTVTRTDFGWKLFGWLTRSTEGSVEEGTVESR